jgi:hypothetical protein
MIKEIREWDEEEDPDGDGELEWDDQDPRSDGQ